MKFKSKNTSRIHETRDGENMTKCGRELKVFIGLVPVSDDEPVTCQHCNGTSNVWGKKRRNGSGPE